MKDVKVTIVVPVYNVEPYIVDTLRSVANQSYSGFIECLIVDDCGTDHSMDVAEEYIHSYQGNVIFRIFRHAKNRGLSAARNTGIEHAQGDYIYFLDSDDEITKDCIEKLTAPLHDKFYDFVIGGYKVTGLDKSCPPLLLSNGVDLYDGEILQTYYIGQWYMMACGKLCNLLFLKKNKLWFKEGLLHEDDLWSFQLACVAKSMYVVNEESYFYKIREGSITNNAQTQERRVAAFLRIMQYMVDYVIENNLKNRYSYFILFDKLYILWLNRSDWIDAPKHECDEIVKNQRKYLGRIPYSVRLYSCLSGLKQMVLYGGILLPAFFYNLYNSCLHFMLRICKKI